MNICSFILGSILLPVNIVSRSLQLLNFLELILQAAGHSRLNLFIHLFFLFKYWLFRVVYRILFRFRKSSKYKCMLCSTVESCQIDVLHHYHSQHSSRLNVTLRPLVDALFTRREKPEESSSQEEEISCDEKSSSILQKPVFTPFIQSDDLKKSDLQKILEFISQNTKVSYRNV